MEILGALILCAISCGIGWMWRDLFGGRCSSCRAISATWSTDAIKLQDVEQLVDQLTLDPVAARARFYARHGERLDRIRKAFSEKADA